LHLLANPREQEVIFDELVAALRHVREQYDGAVGLLAITGDVFDSSTVEPKVATHRFVELHKEMGRALGGNVPTVIVPGNHDRRKNGLFGPHRGELFLELRKALGEGAWVHGCNLPFLSEVIPNAYHRLPLWVVAYDSSYLPRGLLSAGGALRQEDLLYAAAHIGDQNPEWPVLFLLHHHLVPTPLTDLGPVEVDDRAPALVRWGVQTVLPKLVAHADREELTMTALGAGTALSTLHTLGRAVLAIHGHKHYANARLLEGMVEGQGDVLLVSAGSAGVAQRWSDGGAADTARLWPSFNLIELDGESIAIDTVSFAWKEEGIQKHSRRALVRARREAAKWQLEPLRSVDIEDPGPRLTANHARCHLFRSATPGRWDYKCERAIAAAGVGPPRYVETVEGLSDGLCVFNQHGASSPLPAQVHLEVNGTVRYEVKGGIYRTLVEAGRANPTPLPFSNVALLNRYASGEARLVVSGLGTSASDAFASATDLGTGLERPMRLQPGANADEVVLSYAACPPRTLLRVYWRLERD
jgi:3',5'-cyclic AMP phosphodiesterase CpdA